MATKIPATMNRLYKNVFVCKSCGQKMRSDSRKVIEKKVKCRRCKGKNFRPIRKK
jgi:DNA replicative helicase MCM subunit Mcm2 (Cdc46/Mcm family)